MSNEFVLYYDLDGKISQVSPILEDNALPHIMISEKMGIGFCTGKKSMRDYKIDLSRNHPELKHIKKQKSKIRSNFYLVPESLSDEEILLTYDKTNKELKIEFITALSADKVFFVTAINNPIKLLQTITIEENITEKTFNIEAYPFSIFTWEEEETIGYKEIN